MIEKSYDEKLKIARQAYKQIKAAIDSFEQEDLHFCAHWDGCISVGDEFFTERELMNQD